MNNRIKRQLIKSAQVVRILLWLPSILLINGCQGTMGFVPPVTSTKVMPQQVSTTSTPSEIILFCGNPGVGKSALCNSIFQQNVFKSGVSVGQGLTREKQEYIYEDKKYIDTPGLADIKLREQAAKEIEKALKENNNYKIIFVATLESGKIREADLVTINTVCNAIKTPFEYGIIFNKVTKRVVDAIGENGENLKSFLDPLHKQPSSTIVIKKDEDMEDAKDVYLPHNSENRNKLILFITSLTANMIKPIQVQTIDVRAYEEKVIEMEVKVSEMLEKLRIQQEETERLRQENERLRQLEFQRQQEAERLRQVEMQRQQEAERLRQLEIQRQQETEILRQLEIQKQEAERLRKLELEKQQEARSTVAVSQYRISGECPYSFNGSHQWQTVVGRDFFTTSLRCRACGKLK